MKKTFLYTALGLIGLMGALSIGVASADTGCREGTGTVPTSTYATGIVYGCDGNIPIITIYGKNGNNEDVGITIKAMNEGTGTVTIGSGNDTSSYGSLYQWGNNYPFPNASDTSTPITSGSATVDASGYGPNTTSGYYYSGTWINQGKWDSGDNRNLRGGSGDREGLNQMRGYNTGTFEVINSGARQAMCPEGYHIPSVGEWNALLYLWGTNYNAKQGASLNVSLDSLTTIAPIFGTGTRFSEDMQMPFVGYRIYDADTITLAGGYWSSSPNNNDYYARVFYFNTNSLSANLLDNGQSNRGYGYAVRCFKNSYVKPAPSTFTLTFTGSGQGSISTGSIEAEEGASISRDDGVATVTTSGTVVATGIANEGYVFSGWLTDCAGPTVTAACSFTGEFKPITYNVQFTGTDVSGTMVNQDFTYDVAQNLTGNAFTKTGYTFSGWTDGTTGYTDGQEVSNLTTIDGDTVTLTAQWTANTYTVKFDAGEGNGTMDDQEFVYGVAQDLTGNKFTRDGYTFSGWTDGINVYTDKQNVNNLTGTNGVTITLTAQWTQNTPSGDSSSAGGSSGGGGSRKASSTNDSSKSTDSQTGNETDSSINASNSEENTQDSAKASEGQNQGKTYSDEMKKAYEFAYKHGITTMPTIEEADMEGPLTRIAMAKMLSQYAMNVLGQKPANIIVPKFKDVSDELDVQYDYGVSLAYQLGIMGINMKNNRFRPNDLVTRGEFATALSRMLYKIADGTDKYYSTHLAKLMEEKIITNDDPMMKELRGYVMIMLMRSAEDKNTEN